MAAADDVRIRRLAQVAVPVDDLPAAVEFYRDRLELEFLFHADTMAFFRCGEVRLMLVEPESEEFDHPSSVLYFEVDDVERAAAALEDRGVQVREGPRVVHRTETYELWMAFFTDPAGNTMALSAERPL